MKKIYLPFVVLLLNWTSLMAQAPIISVSPTTFTEEVDVGQTTTVTVTISNSGNRDLNWHLTNLSTTFAKENYADWNLPENQDRINNQVWITRKNSEGMYNAAQQSGFIDWNVGSPIGTLWAAGPSLSPVTTYKTFIEFCQEVTSGSPFPFGCYMPILTTDWFKETYGTASIQLEESNEFYDLDFLTWTTGHNEGGGGFSYIRYDAFPWVQPSVIEGTVIPNSSFDLVITLDATNLLGGLHEATLVIASNDPSKQDVLLNFSFNVLGASQISVTTDPIDFEEQPIGGVKTLMLPISNLGTADLVISNAVPTGLFAVSPEPITIAPNATYNLEVSFSPVDIQVYNDNLTITTNDLANEEVVIPLTGQGVDVPGIDVSPESLSVTINAGTTDSEIVTIQNTGNYQLTWNAKLIPLNTDPVYFSKEDYADWTLIGNIDVITPQVAITRQDYEGIFNITDESSFDSNYSPIGTLWSFGFSDQLEYTDYEIWRDAIDGNPLNMVNEPMSAYLENVGHAIDIKFLSWRSGESGDSGGGGFSYLRDATVNFASLVETSGVIAPAGSYDLTIEFDATHLATGIYEGNIELSSNDPANSSILIPITLTVTGEPTISVSNSTLDFNIFTGLTSTQELIITNVGTDILEVSSVIVDNPLFGVEPFTGNIQPGKFVAVNATFSPVNTDLETGTITITSSDIANTTVLVDLTGQGIAPPIATVDQTPIEQTLVAGDQITLDIDVENAGISDLNGELTAAIGSKVFFSKASYANYNLPENQDRITDNIWITRGVNQGIFNVKSETTYNSSDSPLGTLWYDSPTLDADLMGYQTWRDAIYPPPSMVGNTVSMYAIDANRYFDFMFQSWAEDNSGGGFSYYRLEIPSWIKATDRSFSVIEAGLATKSFTIDATNLVAGEYTANIVIATNDPVNGEISIPVILTVTGTPEIDLNSSISFDDTPVGITSTKTLAINNIGTEVLEITSIANGSEVFSIPTSGFTVNPGEYVELSVSFSPTSDELYQEDIVIFSNDPVNPEVTLSLEGLGVQPPTIILSTNSIEETLNINSLASFPLTIENTGSTDLIWNISGNEVTFTKVSYSDWNLEENQDRITDNVWITRKDNQAIFNIAKETAYNSNSPIDTKWAYGLTADLEPSDYAKWFTAINGDPQGMVGQDMSMFLETDNMYFDIVFHSYAGSNTGGGFSYSRTEVLPDWLSFSETSGTILAGTDATIDVNINTTSLDGNYSANFGVFSNDPENQQLSVSINITVGAILIANPIADIRENVGFATYDIDITDVFTSFDPDPLTILAIPANTMVVTTAVVDNTLTVTEVGAGNSTITLRAEDDNGNVVYHDFMFTVNAGPTVAEAIDNIIVNEGFGSQSISLLTTFADINGDILSYEVESSDEDVALVSISGSNIIVTEIGSGTTTITVTASDDLAVETANTAFDFRVNAIPALVNPIADVEVDEEFGTLDIDLTNVFEDADLDDLAFEAVSSNEAVVTVSVAGFMLTVTEIGIGSSDIMVTVNDGFGGISTEEFTFTVNEFVGIPELSGLALTLYPNPSKGNVTLDFGKEIGANIMIEVIAIDGQVVSRISKSVTNSSVNLNLTNLKAGAYHIRVMNGKEIIATKPLIIM